VSGSTPPEKLDPSRPGPADAGPAVVPPFVPGADAPTAPVPDPVAPRAHSTTLDDYTDRYSEAMRGMTPSEIRALFSVASRPEVVSLAGGMPFVEALPLQSIAGLMAEVVAAQGAVALQYGSGQGLPELRELICEVMDLEDITASPDDVVVTTGSQQALDMVSRVFLDPGDVVLAEGPSYVGALGTFQAARAEVVHVPMDADGLIPAELRSTLERLQAEGRRAKFLYTVPNFHNPAGVTLSEERRDEVMALAEQYDLLVVEDNPYGLLGFEEDPGRALRSRSESRVIYLGSFSKTFAAGLRVGWVLAPHAVRDKLVMVSEAQVLCPSNLTQKVVAEYLSKYPWREQIKVFQQVYQERRDAMLEALTSHMPEGVTWTHPKGGFYVWLTLPPGWDAKAMVPRALAHKVAYVPGVGFYADGDGARHLRLSYCYPPPERIREGVRRLAGVLEEEAELRDTFGALEVRPHPAGGRTASRGSEAPDPGTV
jgi:2-aminoadipate transaminase